MQHGGVIPAGRVAIENSPRMDVGRITELVVLRVPGMFGRGQGFGELKLRARPSPGVCDSVNTEPQLVTHGEAGEDGTGKKKVLLGKGERGGERLWKIPLCGSHGGRPSMRG